MKSLRIAALTMMFAAPLSARAQDASTLVRIRDEGTNRSHALELFDHLTTVIADSVRAHASAIRGAIILATKPQEVFITHDRLQPTEHEEPVPIGQPRPNNATGPLPRQTMLATLHELGAAAVLRPSEGDEGTMFVLGNRASTSENSVASLIVSSEQYNLLVRLIRDSTLVRLRISLRTRYQTADTNAYNVIAEIPGTDPKISDEVVLLGAHVDSWHSAQGAADNADAVAAISARAGT